MYLIDTNVISEARKSGRANRGVIRFFDKVAAAGAPVYLASITVGELRRGVEIIRLRGDSDQANQIDAWLTAILDEFSDKILAFDADAAQVWGHLRAPNGEHALDKQIAAIALMNDLTVVTRNTADFAGTGVRLENPFLASI